MTGENTHAHIWLFYYIFGVSSSGFCGFFIKKDGLGPSFALLVVFIAVYFADDADKHNGYRYGSNRGNRSCREDPATT